MMKRILNLKMIFFVCALALGLTVYSRDKVTIFMIGDSTMADKDTVGNPERGWGQALPYFVDPACAVVENHAKNGRSTKSFIDEGRWDSVMTKLKSGDYLFIQFGHNDEKINKPAVYADPHGAYRTNLIRFVEESRSRGAIPVLMTSIVRRHFDEQGILIDTHGEYPGVVRELAVELDVPFVDMEVCSRKLIQQLGPEVSKEMFVWFPAGAYPRFPAGKKDDTHLNEYGASVIAELAVKELRKLSLPVAACFR